MMNKLILSMGVACILTLTVSRAQVAAVADATIKGSPYLNETYEEGVIHLSKTSFKVPTRYNIYNDQVEYKQDGKPLVLDPSPSIKKIHLPNSTLVVEKYVLKGKPKLGYFTPLDSGKVVLYSKKAISYLPPQKGRALDGGDQPAEFKKIADQYYIKVGNNSLQEVNNLKSMIASFPDKHEELTSFAKKERISPKKEEELIKLVRYYNTLE